jgi:hypothetical protein
MASKTAMKTATWSWIASAREAGTTAAPRLRSWVASVRAPAPRTSALLLAALGGLSLLLYWLLWIPAYRLNERFEYADLLLGAYPAIATVLGAQLALARAVALGAVASYRGTAVLFTLILVALFGLYLGALVLVRGAPRRAAVAILLATTLGFQIVLLPLPGVFTTDLFSYAFYGEVAGHFGQSPYLQIPDDYPDHPLYLLINPLWRDAPSVYGPVWIAISSVVGAALSERVLAETLAFRLIADLTHWANLAVLWWALRRLRPGDEPLGLALYAWNPLVVFEFAANGHNDGVMLLFLLLALGFTARGRDWPGVAALVLSVATKYTTVLLLPLFLWWAARAQRGWRRVALAAVGGGAALAALAALYLPWWRGPETLGPVLYWLSTPLYANHPPIAVATWLRDLVAGVGWVSWDDAEVLVFGLQRQVVRLAYVAYLALEGLRLRRVEDLAPACARAMLIFLLAVNTWVLPWYFTWPLALAALGSPLSRTTALVVAFTAGAPLTMYWAQTRFESLQTNGYLLYLAPLAPLALWAGWQLWRRHQPAHWLQKRLSG